MLRDKCFISDGKDIDDDLFQDKWQKAFPKYIRDDIYDYFHLNKNHVIRLDPDMLIQMIGLGESGIALDPIPNQGQILTQSTRSYGNKAREGAFVVQRLNTPTPSWLPSNNVSVSTSGPIVTGKQIGRAHV